VIWPTEPRVIAACAVACVTAPPYHIGFKNLVEIQIYHAMLNSLAAEYFGKTKGEAAQPGVPTDEL
jgi:hypothetical protein